MTLPRCEGGRGILDVKNLHNKQIINLRNYCYQKREIALHQAVIKANKKYTPVDLANENLVINIKTEEQMKQKWAIKPIHGKHYRDLNNKYVDKESSNKWLDSCNLFRETKALMIVIQDGVLPTRNKQKHIILKSRC
jgi:frataxin-like iron-binding protein CyaY